LNLEQKIFDLERAIQRLESRIQNQVMPMTQTEVTKESATAAVQLAYAGGGTASDTSIHQNYGFWSRPVTGATHTVVNIGGMAGNGISISSSDERYRPTGLAEGDSYMGNNSGQHIWIANGVINISGGTVNIAASTKLTITSPTTEITGNVTIDQNLTVTGHADVTGGPLKVGGVVVTVP
jgi:phage baseplate assembly protein V